MCPGLYAELWDTASMPTSEKRIMAEAPFTQTTRAISVDADCTPQYVSELAREGVIRFITASDGTKLFQPATAADVRRIKAERLARRGGHKRAG